MKSTILRLTLLSIAIAVIAFGQHGPNRGMPAGLKLTDDQKVQFEKISFDVQKKQIELRAKLETSRLELKRLIAADQLDKAAVEKKMTEIANQQVALHMNHISGWAEKNKVLTADQQKIWKKMLQHHPRAMAEKKRQGRMMMMHERMMDGDNDNDDMPRIERRIEKKIIKE
jgi:Spy/CpxP family protein refolding chaperone